MVVIIGRNGRTYKVVAPDSRIEGDLCYQCDYMMNERFMLGDCPDCPCDTEEYTVLKEIV